MTKPQRIQLSRKKYWRMPANTVVVTRPRSVFQNRWKIGDWSNHLGREVRTVAEAVECFRLLSGWTTEPHMMAYAREQLRGKNLACWCALDQPCHADTLLEIANAE